MTTPKTPLYPEWLLTLSEALTVIFSIALIIVLSLLVSYFYKYSSKLDKLLTKAFFADVLRTVVTFGMGAALYFDWADGVKTLVVVRPWIILYSCYAMWGLYKHYRKLFR